MTPGNQLHPDDRRHVLAAYTHRFTRTHVPAWAKRPRPDGTAYPVQFEDDNDWLEHTRFQTRKDGRLDGRHTSCTSMPTWPDA